MSIADNEGQKTCEAAVEIDNGRRAALLSSLKTAAYIAPATMALMSLQAHASSTDI